MIHTHDFQLARDIIHQLVSQESSIQKKFSDEHEYKKPVLTAIKILHHAVHEGTLEQRQELFENRHEISALNALLKDTETLNSRIQHIFADQSEDDIDQLGEITVAVPQTASEKMIETAARIPQAIFSIVLDLSLLPLAGGLILFMLSKPNFDPEEVKKDRPPILLIHGNGFNESEWLVGRQMLNREHYGSVFSLNYDGLVTNDPSKGIDDYAKEKVRNKVLEIKERTGQSEITLIGHSMGGLVAGYYAEHVAEEDDIEVSNIISIGSPWKGSPLLNHSYVSEKRTLQMSPRNQFRKDLVNKALTSERTNRRKYYNIGSKTDFLVPHRSSILSEDPRRQSMFSYLGHYGLIASPHVWQQVRTWLDGVYDQKGDKAN